MMSSSNKIEKRVALMVAALASFLTPFMGSSVNLALPTIGSEFHADAILISWIATSYLLSAAVFLIPFGRVADILGRKKIFVWGIGIFTVASILCGFAQSVLSLIIFRVLQAMGSSMIFGTGMAIITSVFAPHERGKAMGIIVAAVYVGLSLGPFAGGVLTEQLGWRSLFYFVSALGVFVIYFTVRNLRGEWADSKGEKFDYVGSLLYAIALVMVMYGFPKMSEVNGLIFIGCGVFILLIFILWEMRTSYPVLEMRLFKKNVVFRYSNLAALINYSATSAVGFLLSFYLQYVKGLSPQQAGFVLVSQPIIMAIFSPPAGRLSDKIEPGIVAAVGMALSAAGLFLLIFITSETGLLHLILILMLLGLGFALFSSPNSNAVMSSVERKYYGVASGSLGTMRLVGQMLSMGIAMMLFAVFLGDKEIVKENSHLFLKSMKIALTIFAILCVTGVFASLARGKLRKNNREHKNHSASA